MRFNDYTEFLRENNREGLTPRQEEFLDRYVKGSWKLNANGQVDIEGDFSIRKKNLASLQNIRFGSVSGNFVLHGNHLTTLEGCPSYVGGNFDCSRNRRLTSLVGGPTTVKGDYNCIDCRSLKDLKGAPEEVESFFCGSDAAYGEKYSSLESLRGAPRAVRKDFVCNSSRLVELEGSPERVGKSFFVSGSSALESLEGAPREVGERFSIGASVHLQSAIEELEAREVLPLSNTSLSLKYIDVRKTTSPLFFEWLKSGKLDQFFASTRGQRIGKRFGF